MDYPTRERVEFAMRQPDTLMYEKDSLEGVVFVAQQNMLKKIGGVLLAMHDALDAKQAELDKAHDFIKRLLNPFHSIGTDEFDRLLDEAEAMTGGVRDEILEADR